MNQTTLCILQVMKELGIDIGKFEHWKSSGIHTGSGPAAAAPLKTGMMYQENLPDVNRIPCTSGTR